MRTHDCLRVGIPGFASDLIESLNTGFADIVAAGGFEVAAPTSSEVRDDDHLDLYRIAFEFNRRHFARLRQLIDALNQAVPPE